VIIILWSIHLLFSFIYKRTLWCDCCDTIQCRERTLMHICLLKRWDTIKLGKSWTPYAEYGEHEFTSPKERSITTALQTAKDLFGHGQMELAETCWDLIISSMELVNERSEKIKELEKKMNVDAPVSSGDRSFAVAGPRMWNSLTISLRQVSGFEQFRRYLKNHLFGIWEITAQCYAWCSALYKYSI